MGTKKSGTFFLILSGMVYLNIPAAAPIVNANWISAGQARGVNREVSALAVDCQGNLFASGHFTTAGGVAANFLTAQWDGSAWSSPWSAIAGMDESLYTYGGDEWRTPSLACGENGGMYLVCGGVYALVNGVWQNLLKNIKGNGSAVAFYKGVLYVAGDFWDLQAHILSDVVKWDGSTWTPVGSGLMINKDAGGAPALAVDSSGNLYVGGKFMVSEINPIKDLAKWDGFSWSALGSGVSFTVHAITVDPAGHVIVGGYDEVFASDPYRTVKSISRWNGTSWDPVETCGNGSIKALACDEDGNIYAGGEFDSMGNAPMANCAKWNGKSWQPLGTGVDGSIDALAIGIKGEVYAAGWIPSVGGYVAGHIAVWNGSQWATIGKGTGLSDYVDLLAMDTAGTIYAGWREDESMRGPNVVKMGKNGWMPVGGGVGSDGVYALAPDNMGGVYVGGLIAPYGPSINNPAHWDGSMWTGMGFGNGGIFKTIVLDKNGNIFAGGNFGIIRDSVWGNIAWYDGKTWNPLGKGFNGTVTALAIDGNGSLYAGGGFDSASGKPAAHIAQWNGVSWTSLGSGLGRKNPSRVIHSIVFDKKGNLFVSGDFDSAGGQPAAHVAKWDGAQWGPLGGGMRSVRDNFGYPSGGEAVKSLLLDNNGNLYAGGAFDTAGSVSAHNIARWDGVEWSALGSGCNKEVRAMVLDKGGILHLGGLFDTVGGVFSPYYALCKVSGSEVRSARAIVATPALKTENGRIRIRLAAPGVVTTRVMTLSGREVARYTTVMSGGDHIINVKTPNLARGAYVSQVTSGNESLRVRLFVDR
jgi:hypothetical protein